MNNNNELIVLNNPRSPISEIFRTLRTNIQFMSQSKKSTSILITSTNAEEGKSWIISNLAIVISQMGKRVIIIDGDMRKGRLNEIFKISKFPGLSNYLSGVDDSESGWEQSATEYFFVHRDNVYSCMY